MTQGTYAAAMLGTAPRVVLLDSGDTLVDEGSEIHDAQGVVRFAHLVPTAHALVDGLLRSGARIGLVADGLTASFKAVHGMHGLWDAFEVRAISEEVGVNKPHAAMFEAALEPMGVCKEDYGRVMMLGNDLERDIAGANALGLTSVWLDWSPRRRKSPLSPLEVPDHTVGSPEELLELIEPATG